MWKCCQRADNQRGGRSAKNLSWGMGLRGGLLIKRVDQGKSRQKEHQKTGGWMEKRNTELISTARTSRPLKKQG